MNTTGYFIQPRERPHFISHFQYSGANRMLSAPECDAVIELARAQGFATAAIGNPENSRVDDSYRAASVSLLSFDTRTAWLYEILTQRLQAANEHYQFELTGLLEGIQVIQYDAPENPDDQPGHYDWHQDFGGGYMARRKLSLVAQLSDPLEYDGCHLTIMDPGPRELSGVYQERGAGVVFPSWLPHCVTPIEKGRRYAMVAWIHGSPYR